MHYPPSIMHKIDFIHTFWPFAFLCRLFAFLCGELFKNAKTNGAEQGAAADICGKLMIFGFLFLGKYELQKRIVVIKEFYKQRRVAKIGNVRQGQQGNKRQNGAYNHQPFGKPNDCTPDAVERG